MTSSPQRLTMAQALVRYLCAQRIETDGVTVPYFAGVFAIFGHGNVTCLGEALHAERERLPTWRGQNEQSMALAAIAYAKAKRRRQCMVAAASIGPGSTNLVTAAALAHANRLPVLLLGGDVFASRRPDPVLQQVEDFGDPTLSVNDAFRPVTRYWDRITRPEQLLGSLPQAVATLLDPAECGPVFLGLCQDTQEEAFDFPGEFFAETVHRIRRPRPDRDEVAAAADCLREARRPLLLCGGGVRYAGAEEPAGAFAARRGIPLAETIAGKGTVTHDHPAHVGPVGVIGSTSANTLAAEADVILAVGTRLQDFTTGSWTAFAPSARIVTLNTARWDAVKHRALPVVGDALEGLRELDEALGDWRADPAWGARGQEAFRRWNEILDRAQAPTDRGTPSYAQVVGLINRLAGDGALMVTAAGGLPGETTKGWRVRQPGTFDCEFGYSCMGYEIAGGWGHAMAAPEGATPIVLVGDGSYLMMNSDLWSSVLTGHKMIVVVCDNGGYAVIDRLQTAKGGASFNNLIRDCRVQFPEAAVDFTRHAEAMGARARHAASLAELEEAFRWARETDRTTVLSIRTDPHQWVPGDAAWDVGVPEVSPRPEVAAAREEQRTIRQRQRWGV